MTSQPGKQRVAIHILPNIQRSSQTIKFGQLIEFKIKDLSLKNHFKKVVKKLFLDQILKSQNWAYLWINSLKFYTVFAVWQVESYGNILNQSCKPLAFISYEDFFHNQNAFSTWPERQDKFLNLLRWNKKNF